MSAATANTPSSVTSSTRPPASKSPALRAVDTPPAPLQTAAEPGGILLGEETAREAGTVFDTVAVEPLMLKGKAQPVPAFEVRGALTRDVPALSADPEHGKQPMVGRLSELREIRHQLQE